MKKLCFVLVVLSLFGAACSSSTTEVVAEAGDELAEDLESANGDDTAAETEEQAPEPTAVPPTEVPAVPTAAAAVEPEDSDSADDAGTGDSRTTIPAQNLQTILDTDDWCTAAEAVTEGTDVLEFIDFTNAEELEQGYKGAQALVAASARLAPDEIADDVQQSLIGFGALTTALEEAEWSFLDLDLSVIESLDSEMETASYNIELYNFNECGLGEDPGEAPVPSDNNDDDNGDFPVEGTIRDQAIEGIVAEGFTEDEAGCIVDGLDFSNPEALADVNAIIGVFTDCGIPLERLAEMGG